MDYKKFYTAGEGETNEDLRTETCDTLSDDGSRTINQGAQTVRAEAYNVRAPSMKRKIKSEGAFLTISEVADELGVQQHVLRFWETKFMHIRPLKRGGGRRYYRPEDVQLLKAIQHLLYTEGYTIKGAQKLLKEHGKNQVVEQVEGMLSVHHSNDVGNAIRPSEPKAEKRFAEVDSYDRLNHRQKEALKLMLDELRSLRNFIVSD